MSSQPPVFQAAVWANSYDRSKRLKTAAESVPDERQHRRRIELLLVRPAVGDKVG
jgi:hypothetical protein